jgi:hypothetical protein
MKNKTNLFLFGSIILIVLAIALVAILDKTAPSSSNTEDVRARAGTQYALKFLGMVNTVNELKGTVDVVNVQLADSNRTGAPTNLGEWIVTVPAGFNYSSISQGMTVTIGVDATTFKVTNHVVTAITLTPGK